MLTLRLCVALRYAATHSLSFVARNTFVSPVTLKGSSYQTVLMKKHLAFSHCILALTESGSSALMLQSDSPFLQVDLSPQLCLAALHHLDPVINHNQESDISYMKLLCFLAYYYSVSGVKQLNWVCHAFIFTFYSTAVNATAEMEKNKDHVATLTLMPVTVTHPLPFGSRGSSHSL